MLSITHETALFGVMLLASGFVIVQPVSADTFTVHNADNINIDFDRKAVKIGQTSAVVTN